MILCYLSGYQIDTNEQSCINKLGMQCRTKETEMITNKKQSKIVGHLLWWTVQARTLPSGLWRSLGQLKSHTSKEIRNVKKKKRKFDVKGWWDLLSFKWY